MTPVRCIEAVSEAVASGGAAAALAYLNEGVPHRFSAIYRFSGPLLHNVLLHDDAGRMRPEFMAVIPFSRSFCQYVVRDAAFRTDNSLADPRLVGHALRGFVVSYHSVPLLDDMTGDLWGTLSHFDMRSMTLPDEEFALLKQAATVLSPLLTRA